MEAGFWADRFNCDSDHNDYTPRKLCLGGGGILF